MQGLEIGIRAMAAAGAEVVSNGGCGPDDRLYLEGNPEEDRPKLEKFLNRFNEAGTHVPAVCLGTSAVESLWTDALRVLCICYFHTTYDCVQTPIVNLQA